MMETIFRAAMNHIRAKEDLKRNTKAYLIASLNASPAATKSRSARSVRQRVVIAACTVFFVCAMSAATVAYYKTPASYLSLDINPSVELGVNGLGRIVSATAYNSDGTTILNGQNIMDADVKSAVHTLVKSAAQKGFVAQDGSTVISVTSETDDASTAIELENAAAQGAETAIQSERKTATISKDHVPLEKRDEAKKLALTPGKLSLIQKLQALDPSVTVSEYKDAKVKDIMKRINELKKLAKANSSAPEDDNTAIDEADGQDAPSSSGTAVDKNTQDTANETDDEDSPVSSGESGKDSVSDSSGDPEKVDSQPASSKNGITSSQTQSSSGSTETGSRSSSSSSAINNDSKLPQ
ncbi:anti-sigma-I factor RsgI family protein [Caproiciproducens faecalis]|uniref:Anti-sigma factor RsgI-like middle domain-containing protein n=1 Tax=Caproiciproducens faecalis TaxID=2820301 RepID=A0ABS7DNF8_9FIRM|nr:hypothetical protein [Caproiciproducens faecalis]MBW7572071.1 hypothetical protein [Caproiciproducens faecalis]